MEYDQSKKPLIKWLGFLVSESMSRKKNKIVYRSQYLPPNHDIERVALTFDLFPTDTRVTNQMLVVPRPDASGSDLALDGENLELKSIKINGEPAACDRYVFKDGQLIIRGIDQPTTIEIVNHINPKANLEFSGLYMSKDNYITQCEAVGFRRITFYPDRPDILAKFKTTIHAPKDYPVLLSNGNLIEEGSLLDGRRYAVWEDPFPKPCYLFALVAGNFVVNEETIQLKNGKNALLQIWVEPANADKTAHAMESLKHAVKWDEDRFDLSLDLDRFMIVATDDFNMGAMENKGLNIFNSKYVLANPNVATDSDYANIETVIGHEYFHNWTGDRVTCRDWFQLSLKEGLTVFREQEFDADMLGNKSAQIVKRLQDVRALKTAQFPEDAGPMAHPVRPESYSEIDNFYTMTVYEKGAEVVRMYQTLLGKEGFKKGLLEYIRRYDGTAATCDDFRHAMAEANGVDLEQFDRWYSQAGTPRLSVQTDWNEVDKLFTVSFKQNQRVFAGHPLPKPLPIPIKLGFLSKDGHEIPLKLKGSEAEPISEMTLLMTEAEQSWCFEDINTLPILSLNRDFSAPIIVNMDYQRDELTALAKYDKNLFNRAEAFQELTFRQLEQIMFEMQTKKNMNPHIPESYLFAFENLLNDQTLSPAYRAFTLSMPSERLVGERCLIIEPDVIRAALDHLTKLVGKRLKSHFEDIVKFFVTPSPYKPEPEQAGKRALRHLALTYLVYAQDAKATQQTRGLFEKGTNMTDKQAGLSIAVSAGLPFSMELLRKSYAEWNTEPLLMNKWLRILATARSNGVNQPMVDVIRGTLNAQGFSIKNPNNVYSLLGTFFNNGGPEFHRPDGSGYQLWVEIVLAIDKFNPQVASRLARSLENWKRYSPALSKMMFKALSYVRSQNEISNDLKEILDRTLDETI